MSTALPEQQEAPRGRGGWGSPLLSFLLATLIWPLIRPGHSCLPVTLCPRQPRRVHENTTLLLWLLPGWPPDALRQSPGPHYVAQPFHSCNTPPITETGVQTKTQTPVFLAFLCMVANRWEPSKCPSVNEWINKMGSVHTGEYYSAVEKE